LQGLSNTVGCAVAAPYVLVVDDNHIAIKMLRRYLERQGYEVGEAHDGIECLEQVAQRLPDAIVLDVMMPNLDGYATVQQLRSNPQTAHVPVVIVTALNDVSNQLRAIEAGADDFLGKPVEERLLIAKVKLLVTISRLRKAVAALQQYIRNLSNGTAQLPSDLQQLWHELGIEELSS
jgi:CheY-like chemotaxis protein